MSGEMHQLIAEFYGTAQPTQEDQEKVAQMELFAKLAAKEGIDLDKLSEEQIGELWNATFGEPEKTAAEHGHKHGHKKEAEAECHGHNHKDKKASANVDEAAQAEWAEKRAAAEKIAEADFLGRVMAHAYVNELSKIGEEIQSKTASAEVTSLKERLLKVAGELPPWLNKGKGEGGEDKGGDKKPEDKGEKKPEDKKPEEKKEEKKASASALDLASAEYAVGLVGQAGGDTKEAAEKIAAVLTLGPKESTKIAAATDYNMGKHIRALELLEQAGYEVNWGDK